jgi:hypothetical protein
MHRALAIGLSFLAGCSTDVSGSDSATSGTGGSAQASSSVSSAASGQTAASSSSSGATTGTSGFGGAGGSAGTGGALAGYAALPVAPSSTGFMWQGVQTDFVDASNDPCKVNIALAVGDQAVCYAAASGSLRCAGRIHTTVYGTSFVSAGIDGVEQILISSTVNTETHNAVCVATSETAYCTGNYNDHGQFGTDFVGPAPSFSPWTVPSIRRLATGTWDQFCGRMDGDSVHCAGYSFGVVPVALDGPNPHTSVWIDTFGVAHLDDPLVWRAQNGRASSWVDASGLYVYEPPGFSGTYLGDPGLVVDGTAGMSAMSERACWLTANGEVSCATLDPFIPDPTPTPIISQHFQAKPVLMLAGSFYSDSLCVVHADGSIACMGSNQQGQLGTGDQAYVAVETEVQPPGSVDTTCR